MFFSIDLCSFYKLEDYAWNKKGEGVCLDRMMDSKRKLGTEWLIRNVCHSYRIRSGDTHHRWSEGVQGWGSISNDSWCLKLGNPNRATTTSIIKGMSCMLSSPEESHKAPVSKATLHKERWEVLWLPHYLGKSNQFSMLVEDLLLGEM